MAKIYNSDVTKGLAKNAGIQISIDKVPNELAEKIVPTFESNPDLLRKDFILGSLGQTATAVGTIIVAADPDRDIYVTGIYASMVKDATCDISTANRSVQFSQNGASNTPLVSIPMLTLTAQTYEVSVYFKNPIKIDRGTIIGTGTWNYTAGLCCRNFIVYGYKDDKSNA
jgi:hypothetical protein